MLERVAFVGRVLAANAAIAAVIAIVFNRVGLDTPWRQALEAFAIAMLFTCCIAPLCLLVLPRISPPVLARYRFPLNWTILVVVMFVLAAGGSLFALTLLAAIGYIETTEIFAAWFENTLRVSVIVTLTLGVFVTVREVLRARLDRALIDLRTKERDEAEARRIATQAQLASLESRVQPHFLFNTLNSIAALIPHDPAGAERMTGQLASLLRSSLDTGREALVPLDQELKVVRDYLEIERVRFGDRLRYRFDINNGVGERLLPPLSVQTLVENSVKYGVAPRRDGGTITVRAAETVDRFCVEVVDDGPGFDRDDLPAGHGLQLLRDRLNMSIGDRAKLVIDGRPGATKVRIVVDRPADPPTK